MFHRACTPLTKITSSVPNSNQLVYKSEFYIRLRKPRAVHPQFEKERLDYKKLLKEYRLRNIKTYWERQTEVENQYIEGWNKLQQEKYQNDLKKMRASVVKISASTQRHIEEKTRIEEERVAKLKNYMLNEDSKKANRAHILKLLNFDSKTWYNLENIEEKMVGNVLIPEFVYDQTTYYLKLQEQAILYEQGDYEGLEKITNEIDTIKEKNKRLIPLYNQLVSLVRYITHNEQTQYLEDFTNLKNSILSNQTIEKEEKSTKIDELRTNYSELINSIRSESSTVSNRITSLHDQLINLYNLLSVWKEYIEIVKMDPISFKHIQEQEKKDEDIPIVSVEDAQDKAKADPLQAGNLSDAMTSANERVTSDSASDTEGGSSTETIQDLMKQPKKLKSMLEQAQKDMASEGANKKKSDDPADADDLFDSILGQESGLLEKKFDEQFAKAENKERFLYGGNRDKDAVEASELLKQFDVENFIPKNEIDNARDSAHIRLNYQTIEDIDKRNDIPDEENPDKLNSSAIVEVYKRELSNLEATESLTRKEKNKLNEIKKLLNRVGEVRVLEGKLLLRVFETYKPKYTLD